MNTSSDAELSDWKREDMTFTTRMTHSNNPSDKRMINLYKIRRAETRRTIEAVKAEEKDEEEPVKFSSMSKPSFVSSN